jgi:SAM-dependent methyltransferase
MESTAWDKIWRESDSSARVDFSSTLLENLIDHHKIDFLKTSLPDSGRAVEIGCGSARLLSRIGLATRLNLVAVDNSLEALDLARATSKFLGRPIECICADAQSLPFPNRSFDVVLSGGLLEHFSNPRPVLAQMVRILRPGAIFYADVVPRKFSLYRIREIGRILRGSWLMPGVSESTFGPSYYLKRLEELGCTDIRVKSCGVYLPWKAAAAWRHTRRLDGTAIARWLGWYFMIIARRAR